MEKNYTIRADHDLKIIRYRHQGQLSFEDIGEAWRDFLQMEEFTRNGYHLLSDYRDATFDMELEVADDILEFMKGIRQIVEGKKQSLIVKDAYSTAASYLFQSKANEEVGFRVKTFSTEEAALHWLLT